MLSAIRVLSIEPEIIRIEIYSYIPSVQNYNFVRFMGVKLGLLRSQY
jgi:hypothetical protein